jgi:hypothetical protein
VVEFFEYGKGGVLKGEVALSQRQLRLHLHMQSLGIEILHIA